eukprot:CAMPEP_0170229136 /NCGR_PEP_ID=MMETSP0116_2-20130129/14291_1 /TAXON_ID=400756 /ORGANISM="Durinskia baltica, Strain CSIRO CS-38" /LENGTH=370 /DNA_ID=CAMNT_0010479885 /DNA_START=9 /DNA_END=1118 /DNA_ORIENTATION=-
MAADRRRYPRKDRGDGADGGADRLQRHRPRPDPNDLLEDELPPLAHVLRASAHACLRAGRFEIASVLQQRLEDVGAQRLSLFEQHLSPEAPALSNMLRIPVPRLVARDHGGTPAKLQWLACSKGAQLRLALTTVVPDGERGLFGREEVVLNPRSWRPDEVGQDESAASAPRHRRVWAHRQEIAEEPCEGGAVLRFRQAWRDAWAVGPAAAMLDAAPLGKYCETSVELAPQDPQYYMDRQRQAVGAHQRPQFHIGVTARPVECDSEDRLPSDFCDSDCWVIGSGGHVYSGVRLAATVPVAWPALDTEMQRSARQTGSSVLRVGAFVAETGSLCLVVNGQKVAESPADVIPRFMTYDAGRLFPLVILGPNVR